MSDTTYNGWTNYATWVVNLWLGNDEGTHEECRRMARAAAHTMTPTINLADDLQYMAEEGAPELGASMYSDLLAYAIGQVNWGELASHYLEDLEGEDDENVTPLEDDNDR